MNWNGSPRPTTFVSGTQLTAAITYADMASLGTATVSVSNSATSSNSLPFTMTAPTSFPAPIDRFAHASKRGGRRRRLRSLGEWQQFVALLGRSVERQRAHNHIRWHEWIHSVDFRGGYRSGLATDPVTVITLRSPGAAELTAARRSPIFDCVHAGCPGRSRASPRTLRMRAALSAGTESLLSLPLLSSDHRYAVQVLASTDGVTEIPGTPQNIFVRDTCQGAPSGCTPSEHAGIHRIEQQPRRWRQYFSLDQRGRALRGVPFFRNEFGG